MQVNVIIDDMFAEKGEQPAGAVMAAELGAVEFDLRLTGEVIRICRSDDRGEA